MVKHASSISGDLATGVRELDSEESRYLTAIETWDGEPVEFFGGQGRCIRNYQEASKRKTRSSWFL